MNDKLEYIKQDEIIDDLQLKGLNLIQKKDGFKFGIDAVLLSDFANVKTKHRVMDLCTGTGIVPFLIYGKYNPQNIYGLEIQEEMIDMAKRSAKINSLEEKLIFLNQDLKNIEFLKSIEKFDVVTVNPILNMLLHLFDLQLKQYSELYLI